MLNGHSHLGYRNQQDKIREMMLYLMLNRYPFVIEYPYRITLVCLCMFYPFTALWHN
jgi:hypothetical protein